MERTVKEVLPALETNKEQVIVEYGQIIVEVDNLCHSLTNFFVKKEDGKKQVP